MWEGCFQAARLHCWHCPSGLVVYTLAHTHAILPTHRSNPGPQPPTPDRRDHCRGDGPAVRPPRRPVQPPPRRRGGRLPGAGQLPRGRRPRGARGGAAGAAGAAGPRGARRADQARRGGCAFGFGGFGGFGCVLEGAQRPPAGLFCPSHARIGRCRGAPGHLGPRSRLPTARLPEPRPLFA